MRDTYLLMAVTALMVALLVLFNSRQAQTSETISLKRDQVLVRLTDQELNLEKRKRQVPAIAAAFSRRTDPERAHWLAVLCYLKTLGTNFMPLDLAEIALTETGSHGLSGRAVSYRGAQGVWQLMPERAESHGFDPDEMADDEKCAEAAVRELKTKMYMAKGNLIRAKKLYCGVGPQANAYEVKRRVYRREILTELERIQSQQTRLITEEGGRSS